jgi:GNAT superfamily N-acetyltransferase
METKMLSKSVQYKLNGCYLGTCEAAIYNEISSAFLSEKNLLAVSPDHLEQSYLEGLAVIAFSSEGKPIGHTRLHYLLTELHPLGAWFELGSTWIHPNFRGQGIAKTMYELLLPFHREKNILSTTTNLVAYIVAEKMGFVRIPRKQLPSQIWQASCTCPSDKTHADENGLCKLAWSEHENIDNPCWFSVTPETFERLEVSH